MSLPLACVFVLVAVLVGILQAPRWLTAFAAELTEIAAVAGLALLAYLAGQPLPASANRFIRPADQGSDQ
jgi:hypothetical protein